LLGRAKTLSDSALSLWELPNGATGASRPSALVPRDLA